MVTRDHRRDSGEVPSETENALFECFAKLTTPGMCFDAYFMPHGAGTNSQVTLHSCTSQLDNSTRTLACKFLLDSVRGHNHVHIV